MKFYLSGTWPCKVTVLGLVTDFSQMFFKLFRNVTNYLVALVTD